MNIDQEWRIVVNMARRRLRGGSVRCEDEAICAVDQILSELIKNQPIRPPTLNKLHEKLSGQKT